MTPEQLAEYTLDYSSLQRSVRGARKVLDETAKRLKAIRQTLDRSTVGDPGPGEQVRAMERQVATMKERLFGNPKRDMANDRGSVSISRRISAGRGGLGSSLYGPTATHREMFSIGKRQFAKLKRELDLLVEEELLVLERKLDKAGLPWTPCRGVPGD